MSCNDLCGGNFYAEFRQLDTTATSYDDRFAEPTVSSVYSDDPIGSPSRTETSYTVRVQVQVVQDTDRLVQGRQGKIEGNRTELTALRSELDDAGLIDANGRSLIRTGARIAEITDLNGNTVLAYPNPPGLYVERIIDDGWFETAPTLMVYVCTPRDRGR